MDTGVCLFAVAVVMLTVTIFLDIFVIRALRASNRVKDTVIDGLMKRLNYPWPFGSDPS